MQHGGGDVNFEIPNEPKWHPIRFRPGDPKCGEVLCSFCVVEHDYQFVKYYEDVDLRANVEFDDFDVDILILGLRNLESPGILPVKKPYIKFNIKSLIPPKGPAISNVTTTP